MQTRRPRDPSEHSELISEVLTAYPDGDHAFRPAGNDDLDDSSDQ